MKAYLGDLNVKKECTLLLDSTSALSLVHKTGLGQAKHIEIHHLWLQEVVRSKRMSCQKVHTDHNGADLMTKPLAAERIGHLMGILGYHFL